MPATFTPSFKTSTTDSKPKITEIITDCLGKRHAGSGEEAILKAVVGVLVGIFKVTVQPHDQAHRARSICHNATGSKIWDGSPLAHSSHKPELGNAAPVWLRDGSELILLHGSGLILPSMEGSTNYISAFDLTDLVLRSPNGPHQAKIWRPARNKSPFCLGSQPQIAGEGKTWVELLGNWKPQILMPTLSDHTLDLPKMELKWPLG